MKSFVYKTIVIVIAVVVIFEFTLGSKINEISSKFNYFSMLDLMPKSFLSSHSAKLSEASFHFVGTNIPNISR